MEFIKPLIDNRGEILLTAFGIVLVYLLFRIYSHLKNIDKNLWIMSHDTYDFLEDIHGELVRLEGVIALDGTPFEGGGLREAEVGVLTDELIDQETHQLSKNRRGPFRGWSGKHQNSWTLETDDAHMRAMEISRLLRALRLKNKKEKHPESD